MRQRKKCSPSSDAALKVHYFLPRTALFSVMLIKPLPIVLEKRLNYSIICFLKASIMLNVKVVPNDTFKFGGEIVTVHFV